MQNIIKFLYPNLCLETLLIPTLGHKYININQYHSTAEDIWKSNYILHWQINAIATQDVRKFLYPNLCLETLLIPTLGHKFIIIYKISRLGRHMKKLIHFCWQIFCNSNAKCHEIFVSQSLFGNSFDSNSRSQIYHYRTKSFDRRRDMKKLLHFALTDLLQSKCKM